MNDTGIARTARVVDKLLKIVQGFLIAAFSVCAVFIPLVAIFGEKMLADDASKLQVGCLEILFKGEMGSYLDMGNLKLNIIATLVSAMVAVAAGWYCIRVLRQILVPMKDDRPFEEGVSRKVSKLGWTVLVGGLLVELGRAAADLFTVRAYRVSELITGPSVESVRIAGIASISHWYVVAALLIFFLSFVFRCGEQLQRESDETL